MFAIMRMKIVHELIPLGAKVPSLKMSLCSFLFRVSLFPRCKLIRQISMCSCEWPGRLKCLATGLDRSDPLFFTSSKCSRKRSPNLRPDSVEFAAESTSDRCNNKMILEVVQLKW